MTAEISEGEKSQLKSMEYGTAIIHKHFFLKEVMFMKSVKKFWSWHTIKRV